MNKTFRILVGLLISGFCLWLAFRNFNWMKLGKAFHEANWGWIFPITLVYVGGHLLRSVRWHFLLLPIRKISPFQLFPLIMFGFLINNTFPARAGEVARAYAAHQRTEIPTSTLLGSIAMERLSDLIGLLVVMIVAISIIPPEKLPVGRLILTILSGLIFFCLLFAGAHFLQRRTDLLTHSFVGKFIGFLKNIVQGFSSYKSPRIIFLVALLSICIWMVETTCLIMGSWAFHLNLNFAQGCGLISGISFGVMIPAAPGYIGTYEFFGSSALAFLGITTDRSVPFLLSFHFYQMLVCFLLGFPTLLKIGFSSNIRTLGK